MRAALLPMIPSEEPRKADKLASTTCTPLTSRGGTHRLALAVPLNSTPTKALAWQLSTIDIREAIVCRRPPLMIDYPKSKLLFAWDKSPYLQLQGRGSELARAGVYRHICEVLVPIWWRLHEQMQSSR